MWTLAVSLALAADPGCTNASPTGLAGALDAAAEAYSALDLSAFDASMLQVRTELRCMSSVLLPSEVAAVHRLEGLDAFVTSAPKRSSAAFASARRIEPDYRFPESLVPDGNAVWEDYKALKLPGAMVDIPAPRVGEVRLDGVETAQRSASFPVVYQRTLAGGEVTETTYLWADMPLPNYRHNAAPDGSSKTAKVALLTGAGVAAVGSGLLYGLASSQAKRYDDPSTPYGDLDGIRSTTNKLVMASGGAAALAVGAGVGGVLVGSF